MPSSTRKKMIAAVKKTGSHSWSSWRETGPSGSSTVWGRLSWSAHPLATSPSRPTRPNSLDRRDRTTGRAFLTSSRRANSVLLGRRRGRVGARLGLLGRLFDDDRLAVHGRVHVALVVVRARRRGRERVVDVVAAVDDVAHEQ